MSQFFAWPMGIEDHKQAYTGLLAPSPLSFLNCNDIISVRESTGFVETNGELSITLRTFPHSMETFYAVLSCTRHTSLDSRFAILLTRLSTEHEYIRVNKSFPGSKILIPPFQLKRFTERSIRVALEPTEPPLDRAYGFWLRTLKPPGHTECQAIIFSEDNSATMDEVRLREDQRGTAGIIYLEPNVEPDRKYAMNNSGWSRIRWIKLGFDQDFNPMILLANSRGLWPATPSKDSFRNTIAADPGSDARKSILNNSWITAKANVPGRSYGWKGASVLRVDRRHGISGSLEALNLGISFHLTDREIDAKPEQIWVVDITDTGGNDPERDLAQADYERYTEGFWHVICNLCLCGGCCPTNSSEVMERRKEIALNVTKVLEASDLQRLR